MPVVQNAPHSDLTYKIIGAAFAVHNRIGPGFKEELYQKMLKDELEAMGLTVEREKPIEIVVSDVVYGLLYLDHVVNDAVLVECKAVPHLLTNLEVAQVITYLAATQLPVGILLNFGRRAVQYKRIFPPKKLDGWKERIAPYLWRPPTDGAKDAAKSQ